MNWIVQDSFDFAALDRNTLPMIEALNKLKQSWYSVGWIPAENTITGLEENDKDEYVVFFGCTKLVEAISNMPEYYPGVFYKKEWFDPRFAAENNSKNMLNSNCDTITIGDLRKNWITEAKFIKPINVKAIPGMVIEVEEQYILTKEYDYVSDNELLVISDLHKIEQEWRFFIVDGQIITGSSYKKNGYSCLRDPIKENILEAANILAGTWLPSSEIVMDMAQLWDGTFKIVEYNAINSAGGYKSDWTKIFQALIQKFA